MMFAFIAFVWISWSGLGTCTQNDFKGGYCMNNVTTICLSCLSLPYAKLNLARILLFFQHNIIFFTTKFELNPLNITFNGFTLLQLLTLQHSEQPPLWKSICKYFTTACIVEWTNGKVMKILTANIKGHT